MAIILDNQEKMVAFFEAKLAENEDVFDPSNQDPTKMGPQTLESAWRVLTTIWAQGLLEIREEWKAYAEEIDAKMLDYTVANGEWYQRIAKAFQYGDTLIEINGQVGYLNIDPAKQIITDAAVISLKGQLTIKVASNKAPLNSDQLLAFNAYRERRQHGGDDIAIISVEGDEVSLKGTVCYDPQIGLEQSKANFNAQVELYLNALAFNGKFIKERLDDYIQDATGVVNSEFAITAHLRAFGANYAEYSRSYNSVAGYIKYVPDDNQITWIAK